MPIKPIHQLLWLATVCLLSSCQLVQKAYEPILSPANKSTVGASPANSSASADNWQEYTSSAGGFTVSMPGNPSENTRTMNTPAGAVDLHTAEVNSETSNYQVAYVDYPEAAILQSNPQQILDNGRDGMVRGVQGELLSEEIISVQGYPGRALSISAPQDLVLKARVYLVGNRLYQVVAVTPKREMFSPGVGRFLDSFKLN